MAQYSWQSLNPSAQAKANAQLAADAESLAGGRHQGRTMTNAQRRGLGIGPDPYWQNYQDPNNPDNMIRGNMWRDPDVRGQSIPKRRTSSLPDAPFQQSYGPPGYATRQDDGHIRTEPRRDPGSFGAQMADALIPGVPATATLGVGESRSADTATLGGAGQGPTSAPFSMVSSNPPQGVTPWGEQLQEDPTGFTFSPTGLMLGEDFRLPTQAEDDAAKIAGLVQVRPGSPSFTDPDSEFFGGHLNVDPDTWGINPATGDPLDWISDIDRKRWEEGGYQGQAPSYRTGADPDWVRNTGSGVEGYYTGQGTPDIRDLPSRIATPSFGTFQDFISTDIGTGVSGDWESSLKDASNPVALAQSLGVNTTLGLGHVLPSGQIPSVQGPDGQVFLVDHTKQAGGGIMNTVPVATLGDVRRDLEEQIERNPFNPELPKALNLVLSYYGPSPDEFGDPDRGLASNNAWRRSHGLPELESLPDDFNPEESLPFDEGMRSVLEQDLQGRGIAAGTGVHANMFSRGLDRVTLKGLEDILPPGWTTNLLSPMTRAEWVALDESFGPMVDANILPSVASEDAGPPPGLGGVGPEGVGLGVSDTLNDQAFRDLVFNLGGIGDLGGGGGGGGLSDDMLFMLLASMGAGSRGDEEIERMPPPPPNMQPMSAFPTI